LLERRTQRADGDASRTDFAAGDESANQNISVGSNLRAGANISESGIGSPIEVIDFCQGDAGPSILTADDGSLPIVVNHHKRAITAIQSDGPRARTPTRFGVVPRHNEATDYDALPVSTRARPELFNACAGKAVARKTCPPEP
jgi:hypothetical protein